MATWRARIWIIRTGRASSLCKESNAPTTWGVLLTSCHKALKSEVGRETGIQPALSAQEDGEDEGRGRRAAPAGTPHLSGGGGQVPALRLFRWLHHRLRSLLHQQRSVEAALRTQVQHQMRSGNGDCWSGTTIVRRRCAESVYWKS